MKPWLQQRRLQGRRVAGPILVAALLLAASAAPLAAGSPPIERGKKRGEIFTKDFRLEDCTWVTMDGPTPGNPFFPLVPGSQVVLEDDDLHLEITTCDGTNCFTHGGALVPGLYTVALGGGIQTRVIEERESEGGELVEISHNYFARCLENGSVFYFGEKVEDIEDGEVVGGGGAWEAGVGTAMPGVIMPGIFLLGSRYFQEFAPGVALDRGENTRINLDLEFELMGVGDVELEGCVEVIETSPLDRKGSSSQKMYCPGIGIVFDDGAELVDMSP